MNPKNFFAELKRRNVYKVAIAYAVVGWLLIQIATQVFPVFRNPELGQFDLIVLLIAIGFPVALIIAWAFELTPEGIKRAEAVDEAEKRSRGAVWIYIVMIAAVLSVGLFVLGRYSAQRSISNEVGAGKRLPATQVNQSISEKSLAVLPFENLSGNPDNAYFAAGIQDEIITRLAKIGQLKVISCHFDATFQKRT